MEEKVLTQKSEENEKLNICMAMDAYLPYVDGVVNCMDHYCTEAVKKANVVALAPKYKEVTEETSTYDILRCSSVEFPVIKANYGFPENDAKFKKKVNAMPIDIIHIHSPFNMANYAIKVAKKKKIPIVGTFHTNFRPIFNDVLKMPAVAEAMVKHIGNVYNKMDEVFCVSEGVAKQARSFGYTGKITILPFGTELEKASNIEELRELANKDFNIGKDELIFLYVGRVMALKRIDFILDALKVVKSKGIDFRFFVVGKGAEAKALQNKAEKLGLKDNVVFTGFLDRALFPEIYARADLFLFPSLYDNFGLVKVEAAAYDTPGVYIKDSQAGYGVTDGVNGYLSEDTLEAFSNRIIEAISDREELKKIGKQAGEQLYINWETCTDMLIERYKEIIKEKKENPEKKTVKKFSKEEKADLKEYVKVENQKYKEANLTIKKNKKINQKELKEQKKQEKKNSN